VGCQLQQFPVPSCTFECHDLPQSTAAMCVARRRRSSTAPPLQPAQAAQRRSAHPSGHGKSCCRGRGLRESAGVRVQAEREWSCGCGPLAGRPAGCQKTLKTVDVCNRQRQAPRSACSSCTELGLASARGAGTWRAWARREAFQGGPDPIPRTWEAQALGVGVCWRPVERCNAGPSPLPFHSGV